MTKLVLDPGAFIRGGPRQVPVQPMLALGIVVVLAIAFSAAVVCTAIAASRDSNQIGTVLESFLEATSRGDFVSAYEYFSAVQQDEMSEGRSRPSSAPMLPTPGSPTWSKLPSLNRGWICGVFENARTSAASCTKMAVPPT
ncbi:MAG: hypothetical protein AB7T32_11275 [Dehalococcoidia bacterium]